MLGTYPLGRAPLASRLDPASLPSVYAGFVDFDVTDTLLSQYEPRVILPALVGAMGGWLDGAGYEDFLFANIWCLDSAKGFGLDILGRIVGAARNLTIPEAGTYIGFQGQPTAENWGAGIWYSGADATLNVRLGDDTYRRVIFAKSLANVCGGTILEINAILMALFPSYGNSYIRDNLDGSVTYHFGGTLSAVDYAIATQENILPRPQGKRVLYEQG